MHSLTLHFENCYGIKNLKYEFKFSDDARTFAIYAPNGVMKTSFAQTFKDLSTDKIPCDRMDASLKPVYDAVDNSGAPISADAICVIEPYNEKVFDTTGDKALTLLSDEEVRKEYRAIYDELERDKVSLIKQLKKISGSSNCEEELFNTFTVGGDTLFDVLEKILSEAKTSKERYQFKYNHVFDKTGKVKAFLEENSELFNDYCKRYDQLISSSEFFYNSNDIIFGTSEAKNLSDSVSGNEFFVAGHGLEIKENGRVEDILGLKKIMNEEIEKIFSDDNLKELFEKVENKLNANKDLGAFKKVIESDPGLVVKLGDYEALRKSVWYGYLNQIINELESIVNLYDKKRPDLERIVKKANGQRSKWENAIDEFHDRFINIPFKLNIVDKAEAILNQKVPGIAFSFEGKPVERGKLLEVLSQGEKRALYILNIIFEIRAREANAQKTLYIIDDIADSFDYKNKYAIIEYLNDLSKNDDFYSIILTHNFDFYRTICSRLGIQRSNKLHALKKNDGIELIEEVYQKMPFTTWRNCMKSGQYYDKNYSTDDAIKHILALIPFTRNLIEYSGRDDETSTTLGDTDYGILTGLLHSKANTNNINFKHLKEIFGKHITKDDFDSSIADSDLVYDKIVDISSNIGDDEFNLENKIILAVAIRHKAEEYMTSTITDKSPISGNQTGVLFDRYKTEFSNATSHEVKIRVLESVNIMTPENIHLNSFMYEPILDMSVVELKDLYSKVCAL